MIPPPPITSHWRDEFAMFADGSFWCSIVASIIGIQGVLDSRLGRYGLSSPQDQAILSILVLFFRVELCCGCFRTSGRMCRIVPERFRQAVIGVGFPFRTVFPEVSQGGIGEMRCLPLGVAGCSCWIDERSAGKLTGNSDPLVSSHDLGRERASIRSDRVAHVKICRTLQGRHHAIYGTEEVLNIQVHGCPPLHQIGNYQ